MRYALALAALVGLLASSAHAVIAVESKIDSLESPTAIRAQAVITEPSGLGDAQFMAVAIKEIRSSILIRDNDIPNGLMITKRQLTAAQAWGQGLPFGYETPPITDPEGPWFGLVWPYRDQYDYFPNQTDPLADDVGTIFDDQPGVYGILNIDGIARGGPTDPEPAGGDFNRLLRGLTGNGLNGPASYFDFDIQPLVGPFDRTIRLRILAAEAIVVQQNLQTGGYSEIRVPIPEFEIDIQLPEPGSALGLIGLSVLALRRTSRR